MIQMTMQLPDQLAAELLPAQRWLPLLLELGLARLETPARTTANEIITFVLGNPSPVELVRYHVSDRAQARLQRLLAPLCVNIERDTFDAEFSVESGRRRIKNCHTIKQ